MALVKCLECGGDLSTFAEKCPHCGAPPTKSIPPLDSTIVKKPKATSRLAIWAVIGIGFIVVMFAASRFPQGQAPTSELTGGDKVIAELRPKQAYCRDEMAKMLSYGAVKIDDSSDNTTVVEFDESVWASLDHDAKINQALIVYCSKMPSDGHYMVMIRGLHDGKTMASITDGNYFDN